MYPVEQLMDDLENYRGLSLIQHCQKLRLNVLNLGIASRNGFLNENSVANLWRKIQSVGEV